jgi:hypothetical protein
MFGNLFKRLAPGRAVKANPTCDYPDEDQPWPHREVSTKVACRKMGHFFLQNLQNSPFEVDFYPGIDNIETIVTIEYGWGFEHSRTV